MHEIKMKYKWCNLMCKYKSDLTSVVGICGYEECTPQGVKGSCVSYEYIIMEQVLKLGDHNITGNRSCMV